MKINWKLRLKSKPFLVALFSLIALLVQQLAEIVGVNLSPFIESIKAPANTLLGIFILLGIVVDPTTPRIDDSDRVMNKK